MSTPVVSPPAGNDVMQSSQNADPNTQPIQVTPEDVTPTPPSPTVPNNPSDVQDLVNKNVAAQAQPQHQTGTWQAIVAGALQGLAGSAGSKHFGAGAAMGAASELKAQADDKAAMQKQQAQFGFQDQEAAQKTANLAHLDQQLQLQTQAATDSHDAAMLKQAEFMKDNFGQQYDVIPNNSAAASAYLQQAHLANDGNGASVPDGTIVTSRSILVPKNSNVGDDNRPQAESLSSALGVPYDANGDTNAQIIGMQRMMSGLKPDGTLETDPKNLSARIGDLQAKIDDAPDDIAPLMQAGIDAMQSRLDHLNAQNDITEKQKGEVKVAQAAAKEKAAGGEAIYATDPDSGDTTFTSRAEAPAGSIIQKPTPKQVQDDRMLQNRLADVTNKVSEYGDAMRIPISATDASILQAAQQKFGLDFHGLNIDLGTATGLQSAGLTGLSEQGQDRLIAYRNARESLVGYQRVLSGSGRSSEQAMQLQQATLPSPTDPEDFAAKALAAFKGNLTIAGNGLPKFPSRKSQANGVSGSF